eukprot:m.17835 g.17835  ORF g.17835 m.17835 type:complete len:359 (+) comp7225_c0_seq1:59-1135(+)
MKIWALAFAVCFIGIACVKAEDANPPDDPAQKLQQLEAFDQVLEHLQADLKNDNVDVSQDKADAKALDNEKAALGDADVLLEESIVAEIQNRNLGDAEKEAEVLDDKVHAREVELNETLAKSLQSTDTTATTSDTTTEAVPTTEVLKTTAAPEAAPQDDDPNPNPEAEPAPESNATTSAADETTTTEATTTTTTTTTTLAETTPAATTPAATTPAATTPAATTPAATTRATTTTRAATTRARITKTKAATTTPRETTAAATTTLEPTTQAAETTTPRADTSSPTASQSSESDWLLNAGEPLDSSTDGESDGGSGTSLLVIFFILVLIGAGLFFRRPIQKYVAQLTGKDTRYKRLPVRA